MGESLNVIVANVMDCDIIVYELYLEQKHTHINLKIQQTFSKNRFTDQSIGAVEYTDCISAEG